MDRLNNTHTTHPPDITDKKHEESPDIVSLDDKQLEWSWLHWQLGDWGSLTQITQKHIQAHPKRGQLALFAAAGHAQAGNTKMMRHFTNLAREWGCSTKLISQIIIAGAYNTLGRIAAIDGQENKAFDYLKKSISIAAPNSDVGLLLHARATTQFTSFSAIPYDRTVPSLSSSPGQMAINRQYTSTGKLHQAWQRGEWQNLANFDHAEMPLVENRAELALYCATAHQQLDDMVGLERCTRLALEWGCPKSKLEVFLAAGIRNSLAILNVLGDQYENAADNFTKSLKTDRTQPSESIIKQRVQSQLANLGQINTDTIFAKICNHLTKDMREIS